MPCSIEAHQRQGDSTKTCHAGRGLSAGLQSPIGKSVGHRTDVCVGREECEEGGEVVRWLGILACEFSPQSRATHGGTSVPNLVQFH